MSTKNETPQRRPIPDGVWVAWLAALAVLVVLAINVVHHLSAPATDGMSGMQMGDALFRNSATKRLGPLLSHRLITEWQLDAVAVAVVALLAAAYLTGVALTRRRTGEPWGLRYTFCFFAGLAVTAYATCGAIAVYDQALFTAHMLGHLALVMLAPALLVAGRPLTLFTRAARPSAAARVKRITGSPIASVLTAPPVALACYTAVIVGSHLTGLMNTIMQVTWAGQVEHLVYLIIGCQFFVLVLGDEPIRWRLSTPARWGLLAVAMAVDTFTGVILMMSTRPIEMVATPGLHVNPLSDTKTGGAIMWFGGDAIMAAVMVVLVIGWLRTSGRTLRDSTGWLEQARAQTLGERVTTAGSAPAAGAGGADFDDDDARLASYNEWLASISGSRRDTSG